MKNKIWLGHFNITNIKTRGESMIKMIRKIGNITKSGPDPVRSGHYARSGEFTYRIFRIISTCTSKLWNLREITRLPIQVCIFNCAFPCIKPLNT